MDRVILLLVVPVLYWSSAVMRLLLPNGANSATLRLRNDTLFRSTTPPRWPYTINSIIDRQTNGLIYWTTVYVKSLCNSFHSVLYW